MSLFQYHPQIFEIFPTLVCGCVVAKGLQNVAQPDLQSLFLQEQAQILARFRDVSPNDIPSLNAWRKAFRKIGVDPTQYRSACESLLRRLTKKGDIPSINSMVDIGNLVSIRYQMPVAVFDIQTIASGLTVHFADGSESFIVLDQGETTEHPDVGEVIFSDAKRRVAARRWCWRQSHESATREQSTDVLIVTEAHHENALTDVEKAVADLVAYVTRFTNATCETAILSAKHLSF